MLVTLITFVAREELERETIGGEEENGGGDVTE